MLLPIRIGDAYARVPWATYALMVIEAVAFVLAWGLSDEELLRLALDPGTFRPTTLVTSMFLHVGLIHLAGNLYFLWVYGRYVEERIGPTGLLAAFFLFGLAGGLVYLAFGTVPAIGASGAIAGLMGLVVVGAPYEEVRTAAIWFPYVRFFEIRVGWLIAFWLAFELLYAALGVGDVAYADHFGGFAAGCGAGAWLRSEGARATRWFLEPPTARGGEAVVSRLRRARARVPRPDAPEPVGRGSHRVVLRAIEGATSEVALIKLLMRHVRLEPDEAHERLEAVRQGRPQHVAFSEERAAALFAEEARELGADVAGG